LCKFSHSLPPAARLTVRLFEEFFCSDALADLDVVVVFAELQNFCQMGVIGSLKLLNEAHSPRLHSHFECSVCGEDLVESPFFSSVFFKDRPVLDKVNQAVSPKPMSRQKVKGLLLPPRKLLSDPSKEFP
jgi:hypothetical protein